MKIGDLVMFPNTSWVGVILFANYETGLHRVLWFNNNREILTRHTQMTPVKKCP